MAEDTVTAIYDVMTSADITNCVGVVPADLLWGQFHDREPHRTVTTVQLPLYGTLV